MVAKTSEFVRDFENLRRDDTPVAGGKGANLGEMTAAGLPVPPGFVITGQAYLHALDVAGIASPSSAPGTASWSPRRRE